MRKFIHIIFLSTVLTLLAGCQNTAAPSSSPAFTNQSLEPKEWRQLRDGFPAEFGTLYVDLKSINVHPQNEDLREVSLLLNMPEANPTSSQADYTLNCKNESFRVDRVAFYSEPYLQGDLLRVMMSDANFLPMNSEHYMKKAVFPLVCSNREKF